MLGIDRLPESLELLVLRSKAALGGRVDDQDNLALVVAQGNLDVPFCGGLAWVALWKQLVWARLRTVEGLEVVEASRRGHGCEVSSGEDGDTSDNGGFGSGVLARERQRKTMGTVSGK